MLVAAFIGAFSVTLIMYLLSLVIRSNTMLLIVGVLVGYVSSSFIVLLNFFASQDVSVHICCGEWARFLAFLIA